MTVEELVAVLGLDVESAGFEKAQNLMGGLVKIAEGVAVAAAAAGAAIAELVHHAVEAADEIDKTSQALGVTRAALQELQYAGNLSGLSSEELQVGLQQLQRMALEASQTGGQMAVAFNQVGVSFKDANGHLRPTEEILSSLADRFAKMPEGPTKTGLAMELMGRSGARMLPLLNGGSAALARMREQFRETGAELSDNQIAAAVHFKDTMTAVEAVIGGVANQIGTRLVPALQPLLDKFLAWVQANHALISQRVDQVVSAITTSLQLMAAPLRWIVDHFDLLAAGATALAVLLAGQLLSALSAVTAAEWAWGSAALIAGTRAAAAWLLAAAPIVLLGALIALLANEIYVFFKGGDTLMGRFSDWLWQKIPVALEFLHKKLIDLGTAIWTGLKDAFATAVDWWKKLFLGWWDWIVAKVKGLGSEILDGLKVALETAAQAMPGGEFLVHHLFGAGASSPSASVQNSANSRISSSHSQFNAQFTVNAAPGQDPGAVGHGIAQSFDAWHDAKMGAALVAVDQ